VSRYRLRSEFLNWAKQPWVLTVAIGVTLAVLVATASLSLLVAFRARANSGRLYISPSRVHAPVNSTFAIDVREDSGSMPVNAVRADVRYDPSKLQYVSITSPGTAFGIDAQSSGGNGVVTINRGTTGGTAPVTGHQQVATIRFRALTNAGSSQITFTADSILVRADHNTALPMMYGPSAVSFNAATTGSASSPLPTPTSSPRTDTSSPMPTAAASSSSGTMYLTPASGTVSRGGQLTFDIHENSNTSPINAVQADFSYPTDKFQFESISGASSAFGLAAQDSGDSGHLVIVRAINPGSAGLTGDHIVATVTLKVTGSGSASVTPAGGSVLLTAASSTNVLGSVTGGAYTLSN